MDEPNNQGQPVGGSATPNANQGGQAPDQGKKEEEKSAANTPNYPVSEENKGEADLGDKSGLRAVVRTLIVIVIIAGAVWFFNRGEDKNKNGNVLGENENSNVAVTNQNANTNTNINTNTNNQTPIDSGFDVSKVKISAFYAKAGATDCRLVYKVEREIEKKYDQEMVNTLRGLLTPLTSEEMAAGYISNVPSDTYLSNVKVDASGLATVKFNAKLNEVSGACAITSARAQIEQTLLQFPYVKSVIICAGNNCDQNTVLN